MAPGMAITFTYPCTYTYEILEAEGRAGVPNP